VAAPAPAPPPAPLPVPIPACDPTPFLSAEEEARIRRGVDEMVRERADTIDVTNKHGDKAKEALVLGVVVDELKRDHARITVTHGNLSEMDARIATGRDDRVGQFGVHVDRNACNTLKAQAAAAPVIMQPAIAPPDLAKVGQVDAPAAKGKAPVAPFANKFNPACQ